MLEMLYGMELITVMVVAAVWGLTAICATNIKHAVIHGGNTPAWTRLTRLGVITGMVLLVIWLLVELLIVLILGWLFAADRIIVILPSLIIAAAAVMALSWPRIKHNSPASIRSGNLVVMLVPIQTMFLAVLLVNLLIMFLIPAVAEWTDTFFYGLILLICTALLTAYQRWSVLAIERKKSSWVKRLIKNSTLAALVFIGLMIWFVVAMQTSKLPATMAMVHHDSVDYGGGNVLNAESMHAGHHAGGGTAETISVADLTGPQEGTPDKSFTLVAEKTIIGFSSGAEMEAWTFNGQFPGPALVVNEGDLVEVTLVNKDIEEGVTLHWHGIDVPNAEDGVAGMTQNAVRPGETYTYRFVVHESGSHWYHSHQVSSIQVYKGLFGAFNILPKDASPDEKELDMTLFAHEVDRGKERITTLGTIDSLQRRQVEPGTEVRLRLNNSSSNTKYYVLHGTAYQVAAIDGFPVHEPEEAADRRLEIGSGGRYDIVFTMPEVPVSIGLYGQQPGTGLVLSSDGEGEFTLGDGSTAFDPYSYGSPVSMPLTENKRFDREFTMILDMFYLGFYNGNTGATWAINGEVFPNTPTFMVEEGDVVKTTVVNRTFADHPMHLHGHHIQVLSRNGKPLSGSPLVLDTLLVKPGETYEYAFVANNPGLWMDHCHNLEHAALGMSMHLAYANISTPFVIGGEYGNLQE